MEGMHLGALDGSGDLLRGAGGALGIRLPFLHGDLDGHTIRTVHDLLPPPRASGRGNPLPSLPGH